MSYTYRSKGTAEQRAEQQRQKLNRGILTYRKSIASISARLGALRSQTDAEIAQAIWDDVDVRIVASAARITVATARSIGLAFEDLPYSGSNAASHVKTLRALTQQAGRLHTEQEELRRQQEQLMVTALETGMLDALRLAALSGLTNEQVNILAQQTRRSTVKQPLARRPERPRNHRRNHLGDEKNSDNEVSFA